MTPCRAAAGPDPAPRPRHQEAGMGRVTDVLSRKGCEVHTLDREATVFDALRQMVSRNVGALVITEAGSPVGIFTERDFLRRIALQNRDPRTTQLWEVMTERLI